MKLLTQALVACFLFLSGVPLGQADSPPPAPPYIDAPSASDTALIEYLAKTYKKSVEYMQDIVYYATLNESPTFPTKLDILAVIAVESRFQADAVHPVGPSVGLMQVNAGVHGSKGLKTPAVNVAKGASILKQYWAYSRQRPATFVAYNAGPAGALLACSDLPVCSSDYSDKVQQARREISHHMKG